MLSRKILSSLRRIPTRSLVTEGKIIDLTIDNEGIAVMNWQRLPVNCYNLEFFQTIINSLDDLGKTEKYKGLVMTSAIPKVFSAGIDLIELNKADPERLRLFIRTLQNLFLKLYGSEVPTTVAINGYSAAGATIVSFMCDYRVMENVSLYRIGMNDTAVGIVPGWWVREIMNRVMGYRQAEIAITSSKMYTPEEALKVQMIDELATDKEDAIQKCKQFIRQYDKIPKNVQSATKRQLRMSVIKYLEENREEDVQSFFNNIMNPFAQQHIGDYVEQLKQKKST